MNRWRRSFLTLLGAAAVTIPTRALADRIRILPDPGSAAMLPGGGQPSPELARDLDRLTVGPAAREGGLAVLWLLAKEPASGPPLEILTLDEGRARGVLVVTERAGQRAGPDRGEPG